MNLYAPKYYEKFHCIADKCTHSCCIGWEIDVDGETVKKYQALSDGYGREIKSSIEVDDTPHFRLCEADRCPHLDEQGLCKIILSLGEDYLCEICREHPRFYHRTVYGMDVGLGMACEEACRLILSSDDYAKMVEIDTLEGELLTCDFDAVAHRERIFSVLSDTKMSFNEKLSVIGNAYQVSLSVHSDEEWRDILEKLEYLDDAHRTLFACYSSTSASLQYEKELVRAMAYFVFRHCSDALDQSEFCAGLGFALVCTRLLASLVNSFPNEKIEALARIISEELEYSEENTEAIQCEFFI